MCARCVPAQAVPEFVTKIVQIHDCKVARHGNMIVGKTGSGKSEAWKCLQRTLGKLKAAHPGVESFQAVHVYTINPLALSNDELYGSFEEVRGIKTPRGLANGRLCRVNAVHALSKGSEGRVSWWALMSVLVTRDQPQRIAQ
jgi:hypothetical protein